MSDSLVIETSHKGPATLFLYIPPAAPFTQPSRQGSFYFAIITFSGTPQSKSASHLDSILAAIQGQSLLSLMGLPLHMRLPGHGSCYSLRGKINVPAFKMESSCLLDFKYIVSNFPNCPAPQSAPLWLLSEPEKKNTKESTRSAASRSGFASPFSVMKSDNLCRLLRRFWVLSGFTWAKNRTLVWLENLNDPGWDCVC